MDAQCKFKVFVFYAEKLLFVSIHGCKKDGGYTWADVINSVAFKNKDKAIIVPKNVTLENVAEDGTITQLKREDPIDETKRLLHMQIANSCRMLLRCSLFKDPSKTIEKVASIMHMSLSKTDDLDVIEAGSLVGSGYTISTFYLQFKKPRPVAIIKSYFDNYFKAVAIQRASVRDVVEIRKLLFHLKIDSNNMKAETAHLIVDPKGLSCEEYQKLVFNQMGGKFAMNFIVD